MATKTEILKNSKLREKKIGLARKVFGVILVFLVVGGFWFVINAHFLRIDKFIVTGSTFENKNIIGQKAGEALKGSYYYFVPKDSVFFYREEAVLAFLQTSFPRLATIEITAPELNTLKITVTDKKPKLIWCEGFESNKKCFYLDETGRTYSEAPNFSANIIFEIVGSGLGDKIGRKAFTTDRIQRISDFLVFLTKILPRLAKDSESYEILQTKLMADGDLAVEIGSSGSDQVKFKVLFNADRKTDELVINLSSVLKNESFLSEIKNSQQKLEYLDLRFGQKVFYRFN